MEIQKINFLSTASYSTTSLDFEEKLMDIILNNIDQILDDPNISDEEKALVGHLDELEESASIEEGLSLINKLATEYADSPYAYFYHFLNGFANIGIDLDLAIEELNQAVRMNPNFSEAQFLLGLANIIKIGDGFSF